MQLRKRCKASGIIAFGVTLHETQVEAVSTLFQKRRDLLLLAKTDFDKSLIFQLLLFLSSPAGVVILIYTFHEVKGKAIPENQQGKIITTWFPRHCLYRYFSELDLHSDALAEWFASVGALMFGNFETESPQADPERVQENETVNRYNPFDQDLWKEADVRQFRIEDTYIQDFRSIVDKRFKQQAKSWQISAVSHVSVEERSSTLKAFYFRFNDG